MHLMERFHFVLFLLSLAGWMGCHRHDAWCLHECEKALTFAWLNPSHSFSGSLSLSLFLFLCLSLSRSLPLFAGPLAAADAVTPEKYHQSLRWQGLLLFLTRSTDVLGIFLFRLRTQRARKQ